ncbi:MAG: histone deacetylase [Planctomycetota bacterium]
MKLYYTDHFELPLPDGHRFPMDKYRMLRERVIATNSEFDPDDQPYELLVPDSANDEQLLRAHTAEYLRRVCSGDLTELDVKRIGFPWSPELVVRSRYSTGATVCAAHTAMKERIAANLAGGTHHAFAETAAGYCVFNDTVVAARELQAIGAVSQVLIVDCDVHQGNGTAEICQGDDSIFTLSLHGERNYPFKKTESDLDVALADRTDDEQYLKSLRESLKLAESLMKASPEFVFYIAGADPYLGDRLGRLSLTRQGLRLRDRVVCEFCVERRIPMAISMGGGYANEFEDIVDIHFGTIEVARNVFEESSRPIE